MAVYHKLASEVIVVSVLSSK